jgi:hypothetical protein
LPECDAGQRCNINSRAASCLASAAAALVLASCARDEPVSLIRSPSGEYGVFATVNDPNSNPDGHTHVIIHLVDFAGNELSSIDSRASPFSKWALGWMHDTDIVVLESSDIGPRSFRIEGSELVNEGYSEALLPRACELYQEKYERDGPHCR